MLAAIGNIGRCHGMHSQKSINKFGNTNKMTR